MGGIVSQSVSNTYLGYDSQSRRIEVFTVAYMGLHLAVNAALTLPGSISVPEVLDSIKQTAFFAEFGTRLGQLMLKDLIMIILRPPDVRLDPRKLPHALHLPIPHRPLAVRVSFDSHFRQPIVLVLLMRHAHLMIPRHRRLIRLAGRLRRPLGRADEMLRLDAGVAEELVVRGHAYELLRGHGFPELVEEGAVVDLLWGKPTEVLISQLVSRLG